MPLWEFGLPDDAAIEVRDLLHGNRFTWHGKIQLMMLDPQYAPLRHLAALSRPESATDGTDR